MSFEAPSAPSRFRVTGRPLGPFPLRRSVLLSFVAVLTLAASSCQSQGREPLSPSAAYLQFTVQPPVYSAVGRPLSAAVQVSVVDALDHTITGFSTSVTITLGNPGDATLSGATTVPTSGGVATFSDLRVDRVGTYYLRAAARNLPGTASGPFEIDVGPPTAGAQVASVSARH